jgi:hypothetical protein
MQELNKAETNAAIFGWKEWLSFLPLFITYIILGFYAIFRSNPLLAFGYLAYILVFYIVGTVLYLLHKMSPLRAAVPIYLRGTACQAVIQTKIRKVFPYREDVSRSRSDAPLYNSDALCLR